MKNKITDIFGTWTVTTEGDVEGRTIKTLGTYKGNIDDIALHLADKCYYSLRFRKALDVDSKILPSKTSVNVSVDDLDCDTDDDFLRLNALFSARPIVIKKCNYSHSFTIKSNDIETINQIKENKRQKLLSKMSAEDRDILGI